MAQPSAADEIVVRGEPPQETLPAVIATIRPRDVADAVAVLPGAALSTNSRGETLVTLRGRSERETAITLDGIPLTDPWDGRLDLALLPASIASQAQLTPFGDVAAGSGSLLELKTALDAQGTVVAEAGDFGFLRSAARAGVSAGETEVLFAIDHVQRDGFARSDGSSLPFSQSDGRTRTNTDRQQTSGFARAVGKVGQSRISAMALVSSADYGVAPEGHLNPDESSVRFWRVPKDQRAIAAVSLDHPVRTGSVRTAVWLHAADRSIDQFTDATYTLQDASERSRTRAFGVESDWHSDNVRAGFLLNKARHEERQNSDAEEAFSRLTYATWAAFDRAVSDRQSVDAGLRLEGFATDEQGGRPTGPELSVLTGQVGSTRSIGRLLNVRFAAARLARLPTQRELFGEALDRFAVNPDLEPETSWSASFRLQMVAENIRLSVEPFVEKRFDVIGQRIIETPDGRRRQRINQGDVNSVGADMTLSARLAPGLLFDSTINVLNLDAGDATTFETPESTLFASLRYRDPSRFGGMLSVRRRGEALSLNDDGQEVRLDAATSLDAEVSYKADRFEVYTRVDNATDADVVPQLGLPAPGRQVRIGVRVTP
ncbi:MAG: TonB-dependent receptor [Pseudomonadota bacterium]